MKIMILVSAFPLGLWSCTNTANNTTSNAQDNLKTNPHAVPSHVDTITHEDGLHNQSEVPDTTKTMERKRDSLSH